MTIRAIYLCSLSFLLLSCGQQDDKKESLNFKSKLDNDTTFVKSEINPSLKKVKDETISPYQKELNQALADTTIDDYYKEVYRQEQLISADIDKMLSIPKNLFTDNPDRDLFYFIVFTKSMNKSDGFYSEAIGVSSLEFVKTKTEQFADYFNIAPKLTDQDMQRWAQCVYCEIQISSENQEVEAINELAKQLLSNIRAARKEYRPIIERFIDELKSTMPLTQV